jgi:hypothetical protein
MHQYIVRAAMTASILVRGHALDAAQGLHYSLRFQMPIRGWHETIQDGIARSHGADAAAA